MGLNGLQPVAYHKCEMQTSKVLNIRSITNILNILNILAPSAHPRADAQHRRTPDTGLHIACTLSNGKFMFKDGTIIFFFSVPHDIFSQLAVTVYEHVERALVPAPFVLRTSYRAPVTLPFFIHTIILHR